jgi:enoyl-CoA hydratase
VSDHAEPAPPAGTVRFEVRERIGVMTIDREVRRNALDAELCDQLRAHLRAHADLLAIVLTGAGTAFCAGADLGTRFGGDGRDLFRPAFEQALDAVVAHPAPVIAAIQGPAMGAGMQLAVACDIRVAAPRARFAIPSGKLGVMLSAPNIRRLTQLVGPGVARDVLLTGRELHGADALAVGLVQRVDEEPFVAALAIAAGVASFAPLSVQGHKRALNLLEHGGAPTKTVRAQLDALEAAAFASDDLREGMAAFAEKRPPLFHGR